MFNGLISLGRAGLNASFISETGDDRVGKRIISFIPRKRTPYIRYMQRREEREYIVIPHAVYEEQRQRFQERIDAMLRYMNTDNQCRSRQLLRYFGETDTHDCGHCDVCRS